MKFPALCADNSFPSKNHYGIHLKQEDSLHCAIISGASRGELGSRDFFRRDFFLTWKQDTPKPCSKHRSSSFNQQFPRFLSQTNFFHPVFIRKLFSLKGRAAETKTGNSTPQSVDPCLVLLLLQLFAADRFCGHFQHQETSLARVPAWSLSLSSNDLIVKSQTCRDW